MTLFFRLRPLVVFFCLLFAGCIDSDEYDVKGVTATPSITLPLAYGDMGIEDFLSSRDSAYVRIYDDGLVYLFYEQTLESPDIRNLIDFPDRPPFSRSVAVPASTLPPSTTEISFPPLTSTLNFNYNPENITRMLLKQGSVTVNSSVLPTQPANFNYEVLVELPEFSKNGVAFAQRISGNQTIDLTGYDAEFNNDVTDIRLTIIQKAHTSSIVIPPGTIVTVTLSFQELDFEFVTGFFGVQPADIAAQTISVDPFNPLGKSGSIAIADPRLSFIVVSEYGIPVEVNFTTLEARKAGNAPVNIQLSDSNPIQVPGPLTPGDSTKKVVTILNPRQLLDYSPDQFFYKIDAIINNGLTSGNNFCADTAKLKVRFRAEVPLYGTASDIILSDTTEIDISDIENSDIESLFIKANIINELPLDARFQLYLADDRNRIIDSIFTNEQAEAIIAPSNVNAAGELVSPGLYNDEIPVASSKVNKIFEARKLILVARMHTVKNADGTQPDVKFKADYTMNVKLGLRAELNVKADL